MHIATGLVAPEKVNFHLAFELIKSLEGESLLTAKTAVQFRLTAATGLKGINSSKVQDLDQIIIYFSNEP